MVKNPPANAGHARDVGSIPVWRRSPGGRNGISFQYSCLENPMDRRAWWGAVHGVAKSQTLSRHVKTLFPLSLLFMVEPERHFLASQADDHFPHCFPLPGFLVLFLIFHFCECVLSHSVVSNSLQPMDCSLPGSSFCGFSQTRILEWVAISFSRGSSQLRD